MVPHPGPWSCVLGALAQPGDSGGQAPRLSATSPPIPFCRKSLDPLAGLGKGEVVSDNRIGVRTQDFGTACFGVFRVTLGQ